MENKFGLLTPIRKIASNDGAVWLFQCDCGNTTERLIGQVRRTIAIGYIASCGCHTNNITHHESGTSLYSAWCNMKNRCNNKNVPNYKNYGGRGITVCQEWMDKFENFSIWAKDNGYSESMSIERKNVNGNYCPDNCEWIDLKEQVHNKVTSRRLTWNGETLTPRKWSDKYGIPFNALQIRISRKWSVERIFTTPYRNSK